MSTNEVSDWLQSYRDRKNSDVLCSDDFSADLCADDYLESSDNTKATVISVTGGKGGVGKTSAAIKLCKEFSKNKKVLLIDCDYNLSNTVVKLGLPIGDHFYSLISARKDFDDCIYKDGNFHLLAGCNGHLELFENGIELDKLIIDIISAHEFEYDYIVLDCPAGLSKEALTLNAYSDYRFVVITPDKSSVTDSYSLMKILNTKYGVKTNHILINKISNDRQYCRLVKILSETVDKYLDCSLHILGAICRADVSVDKFDKVLLNENNSELNKCFNKVIKKFSEEELGISDANHFMNVRPDTMVCNDNCGHEVQLTVS